RRHAAHRLQRVLRRDQPPDLVEVELLQGELADMKMPAMRRVERAAEEADPPRAAPGEEAGAGEEGVAQVAPLGGAQGSAGPLPGPSYLSVVSWSAPTGARAWSRPVEMPISAPMPNSPPSANWVEALCSTMALSISARNRSAAAASPVTIVSV